ncbi:MAG: endonuclease/exonuclease/phosphatase family protein, partial [Planctomycetota bacterium]
MKKRRRWPKAILLVLLAGGLVYHASLHAPTGPAEGVALQGKITAAPSEQRSIRIGTFNIHAGKGRDGRRDLDRVADCIALDELDFVALNEIRHARLWQGEDQAERLGRRLGMAWLFAPADRVWYHRESGNGLLSALPVSFWQRIPLSREYDHSHRNAVLVGLRHRGRTIHVLLTHITRRDDRDRQSQLRAVIAMYLALAEPAILVGDLNSDADDPLVRRLLEIPGVGDPVGEILGPDTPRRIDWIFTRGLRTIDAGLRDDGASDHPLIWAELELLP